VLRPERIQPKLDFESSDGIPRSPGEHFAQFQCKRFTLKQAPLHRFPKRRVEKQSALRRMQMSTTQ
jgi:hypothetical protein